MKNYRIAASLFLVFGLLLTAMPASADPIGLRVRVEYLGDNSGTVVTDNGALDGNANAGLVLASFGGSNITMSSSSETGGEAQLLLVALAFDTAGHYQITLINDGFNPGPDGPMNVIVQLDTEITGAPTSTGSAQSYVGLDNAVPDLGVDGIYAAGGLSGPITFPGLTPIYTPGATFGTAATTTIDSANVTKSGPFSIVSTATVWMAQAGNLDLTMQVAAVPLPEQSSLLLLSIGLLFILGTAYLRI